MAWVIVDESCELNFQLNGVSYRTIPKELIVLEIVLAGEPLNDTLVDNIFVRYEGKYAIELPYNDVAVGVMTYASAELLRAAIESLINVNPCSGGGAGVDEFSLLTDAYDLSAAPAFSVPINNGGVLIPANIYDTVPIIVDAATTAALAGTWNYANGAAGVGATLTRTTNGAFETQDGVTAAINRKYLIKNWTGANRLRNGVYTLTTVGTAGAAAVLTRSTDSDTQAEIDGQIVLVSSGTTLRGSSWRQTTSAPIMGTSIIVYQTNAVAAPSVSPTPITVVAAQALVTAGTVVVGRVYSITDSSQAINVNDRILVQGIGADTFNQVALYIDTVNNQRNEIQYILDDTPSDLIIYRKDNNGNEFWDASGASIIACPIWGNVDWVNNKFYRTIFTGAIGNSAVSGCTFNSGCALAMGTVNNLIFREVELLRGTTMDFNQDDLLAVSCVFGASTFTWAATSFFDSVLYSRIVSSGVITTGTYGLTTQIGYSVIESGTDIDFSVITNTSLNYITTKQGSNNLMADVDMSDANIFTAGAFAPQYNTLFVERLRMINNSGITITTMTITNGTGIKLWAESGSTYTFTHVAIGAATAGQLVRTGGAGNSVVVGYATASDIVEYYAPVEANANPTQTLFVKLT